MLRVAKSDFSILLNKSNERTGKLSEGSAYQIIIDFNRSDLRDREPRKVFRRKQVLNTFLKIKADMFRQFLIHQFNV